MEPEKCVRCRAQIKQEENVMKMQSQQKHLHEKIAPTVVLLLSMRHGIESRQRQRTNEKRFFNNGQKLKKKKQIDTDAWCDRLAYKKGQNIKKTSKTNS